MPVPQRARMIEFDQGSHAYFAFVRTSSSPADIISQLNLDPLPKGVIWISGGATDFPLEIVEPTVALIEAVIVPLVYEHDLLVVDGGTEAGIMKIIGEVFERAKYHKLNIIGYEEDKLQGQNARSWDPLLMGFVPEPKVSYPGVDRSPPDYAPLDPNHIYFVMVLDAKEWGQEVECMFSFLGYLATQRQIPTINIVANGGRVTIKEAYHAAQQGRHVVVLEGSKRAAEVIVAALDGVSDRTLVSLLRAYGITTQRHEVEETVYWLNSIAKYDKITRFDFLSRPPGELREIILSKMGLV